MYRIRFHGRGGQGMKTASRVLGTAFFLEGFEVQDAPRSGAERRGAPISAYVRADRKPIHERGIIVHPDLVIVADSTLVGVAAAGVTAGAGAGTALLIAGDEEASVWRQRLKVDSPVVVMAPSPVEARGDLSFVGVACAGAAARLLGLFTSDDLRRAIAEELDGLGDKTVAENVRRAVAAYDSMTAFEGVVEEGAGVGDGDGALAAWVDLPLEVAEVSAPAIHAVANSVQVRTGLWRTMRPVLEAERCNKCVWICGSFCPDGVISADAAGYPALDLDHCKGCMVCIVQCPRDAFTAVPEAGAALEEGVRHDA